MMTRHFVWHTSGLEAKNMEELEQVMLFWRLWVMIDSVARFDETGPVFSFLPKVIVPQMGDHVFKDELVLLCGKQAGTIRGTLQVPLLRKALLQLHSIYYPVLACDYTTSPISVAIRFEGLDPRLLRRT